MTEELIKSNSRVKDHGEVFTPKRIVKLMLDQPEITAEINDLHATFLEPSAGEGAFLVELLRRKLHVAMRDSKSSRAFNTNSLIALSTLYGIEYMDDNVEMLVMNMITTFNREYECIMQEQYNDKPNQHVEASAKVIIQANMQQGDTLKRINSEGDQIIFSEWKDFGAGKVQRTEYTFESIINQDGPTGTVKGATEEMDLFADTGFFEDSKAEEQKTKQYSLCSWINVYRQKIE